jgi:hypothetical protein
MTNLRHLEVGDSARRRSEFLPTVSPRLPNILVTIFIAIAKTKFCQNLRHREVGILQRREHWVVLRGRRFYKEEVEDSTYSKPLFAERFSAQKVVNFVCFLSALKSDIFGHFCRIYGHIIIEFRVPLRTYSKSKLLSFSSSSRYSHHARVSRIPGTSLRHPLRHLRPHFLPNSGRPFNTILRPHFRLLHFHQISGVFDDLLLATVNFRHPRHLVIVVWSSSSSSR